MNIIPLDQQVKWAKQGLTQEEYDEVINRTGYLGNNQYKKEDKPC